MKSGSLNLLEPSGPVQASNGNVLPLQIIMTLYETRFADTVYTTFIQNIFRCVK